MSQRLTVQCFNVSSDGFQPVTARAWTTPSGTPTPQTCSRGLTPLRAGGDHEIFV
jgi:hypothetical protein